MGDGSLKAMNTALLAKWLSRLKTDNSSLWVRVIFSIHRGSQKWESAPEKRSLGGSWKQICQADIENNNGNSRMMERWVGELPLNVLFPDLTMLEKQKDILLMECYEWVEKEMKWKWRWKRRPVSPKRKVDLQNYIRIISSVVVSLNPDCWLWKESDGTCSNYVVKSLWWELDNADQQVQNSTFWLKWLPIKINCFIWRLLLDRIATKHILSTRDINVGDLCCAVCGSVPETTQHLFVHCKGFINIWAIIFDWVKLPRRTNFESVEEIMEFPSAAME
ncbi:uncharacterized protein LOC143601986 [Bidens hawaiensis]|uniref:uncharacterized protein LOC143601986 n=1 Tax=Bidens hawaiensis TaxID=980011 RepID=UPI00404B141E